MVSAFLVSKGRGGKRRGEPTTEAKTAVVANSELANPSCSPTATASAVTVAECEDGIPPEPTSCFASHRFSLYLHVGRARGGGEGRCRSRQGGSSDPGTAWKGECVPGGEDLDGLRDGEGEHRGDERAVGEHGQVGERGRARRRGGGAGDDGFRHGLTIGHARLWEWKGPPASA
jgi:hypothetical protein|uniref:Uncharacterized protein n=1 Tax=Zea mays TaxID=4577 RepID=C0HFV4_MAIZE|nr:unknown [Zea mays]